MARAGTPPELLDRIAAAVVKMKEDPVALQKLEEAGVVPIMQSRAAFAAQIQRETAMWGKALKDSGIKAE